MLWMMWVACTGTKNVEENFGEALLERLRRDQPNIVVDKSEEKLYLVRGGKIVKSDEEEVSWNISLGTVPEGHKLKEGDKKTPEGLYRYSDYNASSSYHGSLLIHYPSPVDASAAVEDGRITKAIQQEIERAAKKKQAPPMLTGMGGYILVHGTHKKGDKLFPSNVRYLYTDGCVGMSNDDIDELRAYLDDDGALNTGEILIVP